MLTKHIIQRYFIFNDGQSSPLPGCSFKDVVTMYRRAIASTIRDDRFHVTLLGSGWIFVVPLEELSYLLKIGSSRWAEENGRTMSSILRCPYGPYGLRRHVVFTVRRDQSILAAINLNYQASSA